MDFAVFITLKRKEYILYKLLKGRKFSQVTPAQAQKSINTDKTT